MIKQKNVTTSLGQLTVSTLTLGEIRRIDEIFATKPPTPSLSWLSSCFPVVYSSIRRVHPELSVDQLESSLTMEDFIPLFAAMLEVSGLQRAASGEAAPVTA